MEKFEVGKHIYNVYAGAIIDFDSLVPNLVFKKYSIEDYICVGVGKDDRGFPFGKYKLLSVQTNETIEQVDDDEIYCFYLLNWDKMRYCLDYGYEDNSPWHEWRMQCDNKAKALSEIRKAVSEFVGNLKNAANDLERFVVEIGEGV